MSDSLRSMNVLRKIINTAVSPEQKTAGDEGPIEKHFRLKQTGDSLKIKTRPPGRPKVPTHLKARNFTLCLASKYIKFLDHLEVKDKKVQGRGRKIRFIIDQFIELQRRQLAQMAVFKEALIQVDKILAAFSGQVKQGQKLTLSQKEKSEISKAVGQVHILMKVLAFTPKDLHRILPRKEWATVAFCLDWMKKNE